MKHFPESEFIINADGSVFHLHLQPEQLRDKIILVGDPGRVDLVASFFDTREFEVSSREFHTIGGTYKGKSVMCLSHGIGTDNIDIVVNELDALANIDFPLDMRNPISAVDSGEGRYFGGITASCANRDSRNSREIYRFRWRA